MASGDPCELLCGCHGFNLDNVWRVSSLNVAWLRAPEDSDIIVTPLEWPADTPGARVGSSEHVVSVAPTPAPAVQVVAKVHAWMFPPCDQRDKYSTGLFSLSHALVICSWGCVVVCGVAVLVKEGVQWSNSHAPSVLSKNPTWKRVKLICRIFGTCAIYIYDVLSDLLVVIGFGLLPGVALHDAESSHCGGVTNLHSCRVCLRAAGQYSRCIVVLSEVHHTGAVVL